jgi:hypothetical protein
MRDRRAIWIVLCGLLITSGCRTRVVEGPLVQKVIDLNTPAAAPTVISRSGRDSIKFVAVPPPYADTYVTFSTESPCDALSLELEKGSAICTIPKTAQLGRYCYGPVDGPMVKPRSCPACQIVVIPEGGPTPPFSSCPDSNVKMPSK